VFCCGALWSYFGKYLMPTIHTNDVCWFPFALCTVGLVAKILLVHIFTPKILSFFLYAA